MPVAAVVGVGENVNKWRVNIPWRVLEEHLHRTISDTYVLMEQATTLDEMYRLQGEIRRLKKLLNLPGTLAILYDKEGE